jgi:hypothetical protein
MPEIEISNEVNIPVWMPQKKKLAVYSSEFLCFFTSVGMPVHKFRGNREFQV